MTPAKMMQSDRTPAPGGEQMSRAEAAQDRQRVESTIHRHSCAILSSAEERPLRE
jgi:hypothetical protein